jgi:hypothetical protein
MCKTLQALRASVPAPHTTNRRRACTLWLPQAFEAAFASLRQQQQHGRPAADFFGNVSQPALAQQLNCFTIPGMALKLGDLWAGRLLKTAGCGTMRVINGW